MCSISGPEDTYRKLVQQTEGNWLRGLIAFAILEEQKVEWMRHMESTSGALPTGDQVRRWYQHQPESALRRVQGAAEVVLNEYSGALTESIEKGYRKEVIDRVVLSTIRSSKKFWPTFIANVAAGCVAALLFSSLLVLLTIIVFRDPSPIAMIRQVQEIYDGKQ